MFSAKFNHFNGRSLVSSPTPTLTRTPTPTPTRAGSFTPVAFVVTTGTSRSVPAGATSMKAWVIGGGGGGSYEPDCGGYSDGGYGGESVRTYVVTGGTTVTYTVGAAGVKGNAATAPYATAGGTTTLTYNGVTITATGGNGGDTTTGTGSGGNFNRSFLAGGVLDFQGRVAAVTLSGSALNAGFAGIGDYTQASATNGSPGGIVLYFT